MDKIFKKNYSKKTTTVFTPEHTISAFIDLPSGVSPTEAIWHTASIALDTEKICFVYSLADEGVYFIAAPAKDFLGKNDSASPLASALPGNPEHKGDGAYICSIGGNLYSVVIKGKTTLTCYIGDKASVLKFSEGHAQFWVDKITTNWSSLTQFQQRETTKLMTYISLASFALTLIFGGLAYAFQYKAQLYIAETKAKQNKIATMEETNLLSLHVANQNNPTNRVLKNYLNLSSFIVKQNGKIINYEYRNNRVKYNVELPPTAINLTFFGKDITPIIKDDIIYIEKEEEL